MSKNTHHSCLNCGAHFTGYYCNQCGQSASVQKLNWHSLLEEFLHFFTHAEHSFLYTTKSMFGKPGKVVKEFLDGKRKKVHKPITFVLIWFAIYKLIDAVVAYVVKLLELPSLERTETVLGIKWMGTRNSFLLQNEQFITILLMAPILVLLGWGVFRKTNTSFVERWVAILYGAAYTAIISVFLSITGLVIKLLHINIGTGSVNDVYFLVYFVGIAWFIYGFEKAYRPGIPFIQKIIMALLMSFVANYAADFVWYLLYRFVPVNG